jgi:hypothetical protein
MVSIFSATVSTAGFLYCTNKSIYMRGKNFDENVVRKLSCMPYYRYFCTYDLYGTVPNLMFLMGADQLRGQVGRGWALEIGPCEMASSLYECHLGLKKV